MERSLSAHGTQLICTWNAACLHMERSLSELNQHRNSVQIPRGRGRGESSARHNNFTYTFDSAKELRTGLLGRLGSTGELLLTGSSVGTAGLGEGVCGDTMTSHTPFDSAKQLVDSSNNTSPKC